MSPIYAHWETCTPPSPSLTLRFVPIFGHALLEYRFNKYVECMLTVQRNLLFIRVAVNWCLYLCGLATVVLVWVVVVRRRRWGACKQVQAQDGDGDGDGGDEKDNNEEDKKHREENAYHEDSVRSLSYNRSTDESKVGSYDDSLLAKLNIPFLNCEELLRLRCGSVLGVGCFGSVWPAIYDGTAAIVKQLIDTSQLKELLIEAWVLVELNGAGGAPRLLAVCMLPLALVQEYVGQTYDEYLSNCSVEGFLKSLLAIFDRLEEIHEKGYVHNDLKMNNITFSGSVRKPEFHIIDFGWACHLSQPALKKEEKQERQAKKKAIEAIERGGDISYFKNCTIQETEDKESSPSPSCY